MHDIAKNPKLPKTLHAAYDWTDSAGELERLRDLSGHELNVYIRDSSANSREHGVFVDESELRDLHTWLQS